MPEAKVKTPVVAPEPSKQLTVQNNFKPTQHANRVENAVVAAEPGEKVIRYIIEWCCSLDSLIGKPCSEANGSSVFRFTERRYDDKERIICCQICGPWCT